MYWLESWHSSCVLPPLTKLAAGFALLLTKSPPSTSKLIVLAVAPDVVMASAEALAAVKLLSLRMVTLPV